MGIGNARPKTNADLLHTALLRGKGNFDEAISTPAELAADQYSRFWEKSGDLPKRLAIPRSEPVAQRIQIFGMVLRPSEPQICR
jgi:hypothetical protein